MGANLTKRSRSSGKKCTHTHRDTTQVYACCVWAYDIVYLRSKSGRECDASSVAKVTYKVFPNRSIELILKGQDLHRTIKY